MKDLLRLMKALSECNRLRVVAALAENESLCACQLLELLGVSGATVSRHLEQLCRAGVVDGVKHGRWVYYRLLRSSETAILIDWLLKELNLSAEIAADRKRLAEIMSEDAESICRRQRMGSF